VTAGDTFVLKKTVRSKEHLWIVITDKDSDGKVAIVNLTTYRPESSNYFHDTTVRLARGDHGFIRHDSVVVYGDAQIVCAEALVTAVQSGVGRTHTTCDVAVLGKIQQGIFDSPHTKENVLEYARERLS